MHPFRSHEWNDFSAAQKNAGLEIGKKFWREAIDEKIEKLIVLGKQIKPHVLSMTGAQIDAMILSGWGEQTLERYTTATGMEVFIMPHLSRFKLFTRPECRGPLIAFFKYDLTCAYLAGFAVARLVPLIRLHGSHERRVVHLTCLAR